MRQPTYRISGTTIVHIGGPDYSGSVNSENPHIAVPKSLVAIAPDTAVPPRYIGTIPILVRSGYPDRNSGSHTSPETKSTYLYLFVETHNNVHEGRWTEVSSKTRSSRSRAAEAPCRNNHARELRRLQDMKCEPPNGHACRGLCGGHLHGMCCEVEMAAFTACVVR